ncbi:MAG TPA: acetyl-CoA carboxylase biotin carboxylase subunit [Thermoanaerobaculia bacterium]|nr:acetyl-CoA carboxylase biotin carboxylase subunit [Thermoanaerobaculia bacterium]
MKVLIANRGEIAVRIIRACKELGYPTVSVFSEADRAALHVLYADQAVAIGPAPSSESYLRIDRLLDAARATGAEAVHPGYGFLAENADFAEAVRDAGLVFIGPSSQAIRAMGSKTESRRRMKAAGVSIVPGLEDPIRDFGELEAFARGAGFPLMIKASAGGGGKGMRLVREPSELAPAYERVASEAVSFFGDPAVYAEKAIETPRHIEVQVLGDQHGNVVHLGERECTLQRRHQKVIEECPSPVVDAALRERLGSAAVLAARAVDYDSAGTVEFLMSREGTFYFLEMNTRLQVEHPVTEAVTGIDLVKEQIRIARGEELSMRQEQVRMQGHAIECRIYAENPFHNFSPSPGTIRHLALPQGPGVRNDNGVYSGYAVPLHYDPMLSKLIVFGADRQEAIARMKRALAEYRIDGIETTIPFYSALMESEDFRAARFDTGFLDRFLRDVKLKVPVDSALIDAAVTAAAILAFEESQNVRLAPRDDSGWRRAARLEGVRGRRS